MCKIFVQKGDQKFRHPDVIAAVTGTVYRSKRCTLVLHAENLFFNVALGLLMASPTVRHIVSAFSRLKGTFLP